VHAAVAPISVEAHPMLFFQIGISKLLQLSCSRTPLQHTYSLCSTFEDVASVALLGNHLKGLQLCRRTCRIKTLEKCALGSQAVATDPADRCCQSISKQRQHTHHANRALSLVLKFSKLGFTSALPHGASLQVQ
jgi:hypothetical protein